MQGQEDFSIVPNGVLFERDELINNGAAVTWKIMFSDGIAAPTPYLVPADGNLLRIARLRRHARCVDARDQPNGCECLRRRRALGFALQRYPAALAPYKVETTPRHNGAPRRTYAAGSGRYATQSLIRSPNLRRDVRL